MTQWVHLWYSRVVGKGVIYTRSHDTSSHHIGTYLELSGRTGTGERGPGDTGESEPGARVMRKYTSTARRVMRRGHRQMPRDSRVLPHLVTDHLSRDQTPGPWTSAWPRKRDTWHRDGARLRDKWDLKDRAVYSDHKTAHGVKGES